MLRFVSIIFIFVMTACGNYNNVKSPFPNPSNTTQSEGEQPKTGSSLDFATIKKEILTPHCISCHKGTHDVYENYAIVKASVFAIQKRISSSDVTKRMPPQREGFAALPQELQDKFNQWVSEGAPEFSEQNKEEEEPPKTQTISFKEIKEKVLKPNNCTACHTHYNDFAPVKEKIGSIVSLVIDDKMPFPVRKGAPTTPVTAEGKDLLLKWVEQGAPEFANQPSRPLPTQIITPDWISLRNNIIGPKCILCHNSYGPRAPTFMGTHRELRDWFSKNPKLFNFSDPEASHFVGSIRGRVSEETGEEFYDPMPFNNDFDDILTFIEPLSEDDITLIKKWIELKLPFNKEDI